MKTSSEIAVMAVLALLACGFLSLAPRDVPCDKSRGGVVDLFAPSLLCNYEAPEAAPIVEGDPFGSEPFDTWVPDPDNDCLLVPPSVAEEHRRKKDSEAVVASCGGGATAG